MQKVIIGIGITACLIIIGSIAYYVMGQSASKSMDSQTMTVSPTASDAMTDTTDNANMESDGMMSGDQAMMTKASYSPYSESVFSQSAGKKRVLFFYANWCPTCIPADKSIQENLTNLPDGINVIRVNYNDPETDQAEKDLARKYGVTYQHTFVLIDENDNEIKKWNGGDIEEIISMTQ